MVEVLRVEAGANSNATRENHSSSEPQVSVLLQSCIENVRKGDVENALASLNEAYRAFLRELATHESALLRPPDAMALDSGLKQIRQYMADGRLEDAALCAGILALSFPEDPRVRKLDSEVAGKIDNAGRMDDFISDAQRQGELGRWGPAIQSYEKARELDPENSFVQDQMSNALLAWARDVAVRDRRAALNLLQTSLNLREDPAARELYDQILAAIEQENIAIALTEAETLLSAGKIAQARAQVEAALLRWPENPELVACRASVARQEEISRAIAGVEERVRLLVTQLRFDEARESVENALREYPGVGALKVLQRDVEEKSSTYKAEVALSQIMPLDLQGTLPALRQALDIAVEGLQNARDNGLLLKARERIEKRLSEKESELKAALSRVEHDLEAGEIEAAKDALQKASLIDPENPRMEELRSQIKKSRRSSVWSWLAAEKAPQRTPAAEAIRIGQILADRYEILAPLGSGGMSTVYKAHDVMEGHNVALKVVLPLISKDERLRERFKREVHVARRLSHPNVIRIHDIAEHQELLFISMELVEGQTLSRILAERTRFTVDEFLELFNQFGPALAYIHSQQILHRDIKPQNLMYDRGGILKIMDFGIARDLSADHTTTAIPMGTPAYMSPELLEGAPLTPASDIYSAGTMFFELLTGTKPFSNASLYERMTKPVPRVSQILPEVPDDLDEIIHKCMQIQPGHRFQSMNELHAAISRRASLEVGAAGTLAQLLHNEPAKIGDVLLVFLRVLRQVDDLHASGKRPVLSPHAIGYSEAGVEIRSTVSGSAQHTQAVDCKYTSADEFQEAGGGGVPADVYVLGFIFYEVLLGRRRFRQEFPDCHGSDADLQWLNWHGDPARTATPLKRLLSGFPEDLSDLIERMMQKVPELRPAISEVEAAMTSCRQHLLRETGKTVVIEAGRQRDAGGGSAVSRERKSRWGLVVALLVLLAVAAWLTVRFLL